MHPEALARVLGASQSAPVIQTDQEATYENINSLNIKWNDSIERFDLKIWNTSKKHHLNIICKSICLLFIRSPKNTKQVSLTKHLKNPQKTEVLNPQGSSQDKASDTLQCQMCREPHIILANLQFSANFSQISSSIHGFDLPQVKCVGWNRFLSTVILHYTTILVGGWTMKNMLVTLDHFLKLGDEHFTKNETTTLVTTINPS